MRVHACDNIEMVPGGSPVYVQGVHPVCMPACSRMSASNDDNCLNVHVIDHPLIGRA